MQYYADADDGDTQVMDLSFARLDFDMPRHGLPTALAVLMAAVATRQAASATARTHSRLSHRTVARMLGPRHGAFNPVVAARLGRWQEP